MWMPSNIPRIGGIQHTLGTNPILPDWMWLSTASDAGSCAAKVLTANGTEVSSVEMEAEKGLNILSYDLAFSKKGKSNFLKRNKMKLMEAKNRQDLSSQGSYAIEISGNGQTDKIEFAIE